MPTTESHIIKHIGGRFGYLFKNQIPASEITTIAAHELGHGIWALKHTFDNDYGNIAVNTTGNLMDYTPGATHLAKWQWEIIRYPALFTDPFGNDEEGEYTKSDSDLIIEIIQKIRCAYASNVNRIFVTVPVSNNITRNVKINSIELNIFPKINVEKAIEKQTDRYGIFALHDKYIKENKVDGNTYFEFGNGLTLVVPSAESSKFESLINNSNFYPEITRIEQMVENNTKILDISYNTSYCVLKELNLNATNALIDELADKTFLTEGYENLVINIIRAAKEEFRSLADKKAIVNKFLNKDVFSKFMKDINNFNGLENADNFIFELADLCQQVYADDYAGTDKIFMDNEHAFFNFYIDNAALYHWKYISGVFQREKNIYYFGSDINKKYNYIISDKNYDWNKRAYKFHANKMIYVYIDYDLSFIAQRGTVLRMPAFELAYLLGMETTKLKAKVADIIFSTVTVSSSVIKFSSASLIEKLVLSYNITKSTLSIFDVDYKEYIKENCGENGEKFANALNMFDKLLATYSSFSGLRYVVDDGNVIKAFFDSWDAIKTTLDDNYKKTKDAKAAMEQLKTSLGNAEIIY